MSVTIHLTSDEVAQLKHFTEAENESEAIAKALREFLRVSQLRELKGASGKLDYRGLGDNLEVLELRETDLNQ